MEDILDGLNKLSIEKAQRSVENFRSWDDAIAHAKSRIQELKRSLKVFEENKERGEPWPGEKKAPKKGANRL